MKILKKSVPYIIILAVLAAGILLFQNRNASAGIKDEGNKQPAASNKLSVEIQKAKPLQKQSGMSYDATLEPCEEGIIGARMPGKVVRILFKEGEQVSQGTPLIVLDDQDIKNQLKIAESQLKAVEASLPKAEANVEFIQDNYDRSKTLFDQGAVPQVSLENAEAALKAAKADLESLKANIQVSLAGIDNLKDTLANMVIRAPINGITDEKSVEVGQFVSPGFPLAKVKNTSLINAVMKISQDDLNLIKIGQKAQIMLNDSSAAVSDGVIKFISLAANPSSRTFDCKVEVQNQDGRLRPGVYSKVTISNDDRRRTVLVIPIKALTGAEGNYSVFVVENSIARKRTVTVGDTYSDVIEVKSGIKDGEDVICTNVGTLQDGDAISVISNRGE